MPLDIGLKAERVLPVTPDIAVDFLGQPDARVLGTPFLIYNLEITARNAVLPHLDPGFDTVGTLVNVRHLAATPLGMKVTFRARITAVEDRTIRFAVEAHDEKEKIAEGVHERVVINVSRFAARCAGEIDGALVHNKGMDALLGWRSEFPILDKTVYLISHSLGAMPARVRDRLNEYADVWSTRGIRAWEEGWWEMPISVGNLVGQIIGAGPGEVTMHPNVSICQSIVASCLNWSGKRNKIVTEGLNFPSNLYIDYRLERLGARVVTAPSEDGVTIPLHRMLAAIDEETLLVSVSHVLFKSSYIQDLHAITQRAHQHGAMVMADIYQSAGTVPLNVHELGVDFATGGSVKWLCGGPGAGYLYVRRDLWPTLEPGVTGWMAHKRPFAFEPGPIELSDDSFRFMNGTPNVPAMYAARSGYEIINEIGVPAIREKSRRQTGMLIELADEAGFPVRCPRNADERGGSVIVDVPNGEEVTRELLRRDVLVDYRPGAGIRMAPHFYTKDEELELVMREIQSIATRAGALA